MNQTSQQIEIQWPVTALFNYTSDISNNWEWQDNVIRSEWTNRTSDVIGSSFCEISSIEGKESFAEIKIVEFIPDKKRTIKFNIDKPVLCSMQFVPLSEEETRLTIQWKWEGEASPEISFDLSKLKEILERELVADTGLSVIG